MPQTDHNPYGLRFVDVAAAVILLGLTSAILIPFKVRIRGDGSFRASSQNNLRQIALATLNYGAAHRDLLPSRTTGGIYFDLLPYLEEEGLHGMFTVRPDGVVDLQDHQAWRWTQSDVRAYRSPADPTWESQTGACSYVPNPLLFPLYSAANTFQPPTNERTGEATTQLVWDKSFSDGTSNTIMFTERLANCGGVTLLWFAAGQRHMRAADPKFATRGPKVSPDGKHISMQPLPFPGSGFNTPPPIEQFAQTNPTDPFQCAPNMPSTVHHVLLVAMADGSSRLVAPVPMTTPEHGKIAFTTRVWAAACTPAGGELLHQDG